MKGDNNNPSPNNHSGGEQKRKVTGKVHVEGEIQVHLPPNVEKENSAANSKRETRETVKQWVDGITLFFVILVAFFSGIQTYQSIKTTKASIDANTITRDNFKIQAAPYIDVVQVFTERGPQGQEALSFQLKNYGTTPGLDVRSLARFDSDNPNLGIPNFRWDENEAKGSIPMSPGGLYSVHLHDILTNEQVMQYRSGHQPAFFAISIWYSDVWKNRQQVIFCEEFQPSNQQWEPRYSDCKPYH